MRARLNHIQMSKLTLEEKRLLKIRQQLFGKEDTTPQVKKTKFDAPQIPQASTALIKESSYLKTDLIKIALLTTLALGIQFILFLSACEERTCSYWSLQNNLLKLNFPF